MADDDTAAAETTQGGFIYLVKRWESHRLQYRSGHFHPSTLRQANYLMTSALVVAIATLVVVLLALWPPRRPPL